ncbi:GNAT family N-acetyltransferase [Neptunicella sp. SCSIO 80796]|uniref:GNAT family N-acetyltransferase n=1 Tax=Neptunicella plasticusilytica TaxID=3117012 RepID=UPI003A4E37B7
MHNNQPVTLLFDNNVYLPMQQSTAKSRFGIQGHYLQSLSNYYSPFFGLGNAKSETSKLYIDVVNQAQDFFAQHDRIDMLPMYAEQAKHWQKAFAQIGFKGFIYQQSVNWYQDNIDSVEHYWSLRPSRLRNTLKRKRDKLARDSRYRIELVEPKSKAELKQYLIDYHHVYFDSWKRVEPVPAFIDAIAFYSWQLNELRLGLLYHGNNPVAAQIWFVNGDTAYIYKLAHRKSYTEQSVGTVLTAAMFEHVIEQDKVTCVDFLTGDDNYKKDWMKKSRPLYGIQLCNTRTLAGWVDIIRNQISGLRKKIKKASAK